MFGQQPLGGQSFHHLLESCKYFAMLSVLIDFYIFMPPPLLDGAGGIVFYPRDAMLARVFATATCLSVCPSVRPSVRLSHAGIVPSRVKAGS